MENLEAQNQTPDKEEQKIVEQKVENIPIPKEVDVGPGEWREVSGKQEEKQEKRELSLEISGELVQQLNVFKESLHPKADLIYYPCCGTDASLTKVFPGSRIVFVDMDHDTVETLKKAGLEVYEESAAEFKLDMASDIVCIQNPQIPADQLVKNLKQKGYVVCNNYHGTATELRQQSSYKLLGVVRKNNEGHEIFDTEHPEDYWNPIETEDEFQNAGFSWGAVHYNTAKSIVKQLKGKEENILEEYKKIIEEAKVKVKRDREEYVKANPEYADFFGTAAENEDPLVLEGGIVIDPRLPRKKGSADDLFIYQKIS